MLQTHKNKRRKSDRVLALVGWMNAIAGSSLVIVLFLFAFAKPDRETFFDRYYNISLRNSWNREFFVYIFLFLGVSLTTSVIGLYLNSKRLRRKDDFIRAMLIVSLIISSCGLAFFLNLLYQP
jgi:hypothetical protein